MLREAGIAVLRMDYAYTEKGGTHDAAHKLGIDEHAVVKSLVFDNGKTGTEQRAVMALMHGDRRVSMHRLQRLSGIRRLLPSAPDTAFALTGYRPGGICPFGLSSPLPLFAQETLFRLPLLYINAGKRGVIAAVPPAALLLLSPVTGDISSETEIRTF